uniref:clathrin light chain B-like isoform X1 n=1 Tax=Styela clava TaxID=7725 RepID=UPI0019393E1C|nr:clathrin light chain B-like isoform X1 [Styela clava]
MADFLGDDFGEPVPPTDQQTVEEDPAAAFLAQQENEIAGLESEAFGNIGETTQQTTEYADTNGYADDFLQQDASEQNQDVGDDLFNAPSSYDGGNAVLENGGDDVSDMDPSQAYAAIAAADARIQQLRAEPEKIIQWREEHNRMLEEKDQDEEQKQQEWRDAAKKELEDWERNRLEQLEKTKANNRIANDAFIKSLSDEKNSIGYTTAEKEFVAERDENRPGSEWERVSKLCDFNPKSSKGTKDVSRMRSTLLHLKQHNLAKPMSAK